MRRPALIALILTLASCGAPNGLKDESRANSCGSVQGISILGPFTHENLSVFLLEKRESPRDGQDYVILEQALKEGTLRVMEKPQGAQVNLLELENTGERPVYIQAGDTVKGGQQDRTIAVDFVVPPKSGRMPISAFCVEPGRWSSRGGAVQYQTVDLPRATTNQFGGVEFTLSEVPAATREQKLAIRLEKSQSQVWAAGGLVTGRTIAGQPLSSSYVLATEAPEIKNRIAEYVESLKGVVNREESLIGMAFLVNGELDTIDVYGNSNLFQKLWPKLLRGAALEAMMKKSNAASGKPTFSGEVLRFLEPAAQGERRVENLPGGIRITVFNGSEAASFDTERDGVLLHRQVIAK